MGLAGAAAIATFGLTAPAAQADGVWDRVAQCESGGNWSINTGNGYYGGLQFAHSTWVGFGGQSYAAYAHQASKGQQIAIAQKVLAVQGPGAWPVCSVVAGLTRENGGAPISSPPPSSPPVSSPPVSSPPESAPPAWGGTPVTRYVSGNGSVNVRSGPGTGYRVVGSLSAGAQVNGTLARGWVKIADGRFVSDSVLSSGGDRGVTPPSRGVGRLLVQDGIRGPLTTVAIQQWVGTTQDGIFGPITTKALQTKVGTPADGIWGPKSQAALQDYLGISRDGSTSMNARTVKALQGYLNNNVIG
ncbi:transglycosylase-like protein with SLT domain [Ornithinicoccus hortensis]|uniref:Transglycosylase-like protein with SLT domain n=2 Tax=Ornithinicoccus hortensis TaxID=82346 RepID=A0A542YP30_9MICO|nr:transglycosylase-like protein with SLT domain [Ornithinicoccus hortensis]